jgi:hypothetical protein
MSDWKCPYCGYAENENGFKECLMCQKPKPCCISTPRPASKAPPIDLVSSDEDEDVVKLVKHTRAPIECIDLTNVPNDVDIVDLTGLPDEVEKELIDPTTDGRNICVYFNPNRSTSSGRGSEQELLLLRYRTPEFLMSIITNSKDYIKERIFREVQYLANGFWGNFIRTQEQRSRLTPDSLPLIRLGDFKMEYNGAKELKFSVIPEISIQGAMKSLDAIGFKQRLPLGKLQILYQDEGFRTFLDTVFKKLFLEVLIDKRAKVAFTKAFSVDYYFDRNRGQYGYHYDDTYGIMVKNVSLTYIGDQDIVIKGAQVASARGVSRCAISLPVSGGSTLRFNNQHLTHTTPKPEASVSSKEGLNERDEKGNVFYQERIDREESSPRRSGRALEISMNTANRTRSFLRFWEVLEYDTRGNTSSSTDKEFRKPENITAMPICIFSDDQTGGDVPVMMFTENMNEIFTYLDNEIFTSSEQNKTLIITGETDDPDRVLREF